MRIYITGSSASGKTTYAQKISKKLNIPVIHTDDLYNPSDKRMFTIDEIKSLVPIGNNWIIEGAYYIPEYINVADKVIFLKVSGFRTVFRILRRWLTNKEIRNKFNFFSTLKLCYTTVRDLYSTDNIDIRTEQQKHYKNTDRYNLAKKHAKEFVEIWN